MGGTQGTERAELVARGIKKGQTDLWIAVTDSRVVSVRQSERSGAGGSPTLG